MNKDAIDAITQYLNLLLTPDGTGSKKEIDEKEIDEKDKKEILSTISNFFTNLTEEQYVEIKNYLVKKLPNNTIIKFILKLSFADANKLFNPVLDTLKDTLKEYLRPDESPFDKAGPFTFGGGKKSIQFGGNNLLNQIIDRLMDANLVVEPSPVVGAGLLSVAGVGVSVIVVDVLLMAGVITGAVAVNFVTFGAASLGAVALCWVGWCAGPPIIKAIKKKFLKLQANQEDVLFHRLQQVTASLNIPIAQAKVAEGGQDIDVVKAKQVEGEKSLIRTVQAENVTRFDDSGRRAAVEPGPSRQRRWRWGGTKKIKTRTKKRRIKSKKIRKSKKRV